MLMRMVVQHFMDRHVTALRSAVDGLLGCSRFFLIKISAHPRWNKRDQIYSPV